MYQPRSTGAHMIAMLVPTSGAPPPHTERQRTSVRKNANGWRGKYTARAGQRGCDFSASYAEVAPASRKP